MTDNPTTPRAPPPPPPPPVARDPVVVTDPVSTVSKPDKPIMGDVVLLSKDDWSAWTGG